MSAALAKDRGPSMTPSAICRESGPTAATYVYCLRCDKAKKPLGRSAPLGMVMCDDDCPGYREHPKPDCRWPGEVSCGPGCDR